MPLRMAAKLPHPRPPSPHRPATVSGPARPSPPARRRFGWPCRCCRRGCSRAGVQRHSPPFRRRRRRQRGSRPALHWRRLEGPPPAPPLPAAASAEVGRQQPPSRGAARRSSCRRPNRAAIRAGRHWPTVTTLPPRPRTLGRRRCPLSVPDGQQVGVAAACAVAGAAGAAGVAGVAGADRAGAGARASSAGGARPHRHAAACGRRRAGSCSFGKRTSTKRRQRRVRRPAGEALPARYYRHSRPPPAPPLGSTRGEWPRREQPT
jgi:hypothetical protein